MATAFPTTTLPGPNALTGAALQLTACDAVNGNSILATGSEILVVLNSDASAHTFAITGVADPYGRTGNFSMSVPGSAALATASIIITPRLSSTLWGGTTGLIGTPSTNSALLFVGVITGT